MSCSPTGVRRHRTLLRRPHFGPSANHPAILSSSYQLSATCRTSGNGSSLPISDHRRMTGIPGSCRASVRANSLHRHRVSGMSGTQASVSSRSYRSSFTRYSIPLNTRLLVQPKAAFLSQVSGATRWPLRSRSICSFKRSSSRATGAGWGASAASAIDSPGRRTRA